MTGALLPAAWFLILARVKLFGTLRNVSVTRNHYQATDANPELRVQILYVCGAGRSGQWALS